MKFVFCGALFFGGMLFAYAAFFSHPNYGFTLMFSGLAGALVKIGFEGLALKKKT